MSDLDPRSEAEALVNQALMSIKLDSPATDWASVAQVFALLHLGDAVQRLTTRALVVRPLPIAGRCACHFCDCSKYVKDGGPPVCETCIEHVHLPDVRAFCADECHCHPMPGLRHGDSGDGRSGHHRREPHPRPEAVEADRAWGLEGEA